LLHHYAELLNYFSRSLGNRDSARDVVQESYARVIAASHGAAILDLRALLYRIGRNIVIDDARRHTAEAAMLATLALVQPDAAPSCERVLDAVQRLERLLARLASLPRKRREAFVLVRVHGYRHAEAAAHLGVSEAAIEKHIVRAVLDLMPHLSAP
jgi:RNA polymerase sigma-70 factor (ECF subfamily)